MLLTQFEPRLVIVSGCCGGLNPELRWGDTVIVEKTVCHDYGALRPEGLERWPTGKAMVWEDNALYLRAYPDLFKRAIESGERIKLPAFATREGERTPQILTGVLATGDLFTTDSLARQELWETLQADVVDMEAECQSQTMKANGGVISTTR